MTNKPPSYRGYRFPSEIISHAVWLYHRFGLSFRDTEDVLAQRGVTVTHETMRQGERQMRRFKSAADVQRFLSVHGVVQNLFRGGRHLLRSVHHRLLRRRAFQVGNAVTSAS